MNNSDWLGLVHEDILYPELAICDPHHHLWDYPDSRYMLDEILADTNSGHRVVSSVFVECGSMYRATGEESLKPLGETEFVQGIAAMSDSGQYGETRIASGIVSFADMTLGTGVRAILEAHMVAGAQRFKGIRHSCSWHQSDEIRNSHSGAPPHLLMDETFREGVAVLGEMGLSFDAWLYHDQLPEFVDLAKNLPGTTIVLDHFGGPLGIGPYKGKEEQVFTEWQENIDPLKDCANVYFKLGGINMKINGFAWHQRDTPPSSNELVDKTGQYYEHCINTFGPERCMFESNFPVDRESCSYEILWNAFKKMTRGRTQEEREQLFHDTAVGVYRLGRAG